MKGLLAEITTTEVMEAVQAKRGEYPYTLTWKRYRKEIADGVTYPDHRA